MKNKYKHIKEGLDEHYDARSYSPVKHRIALGLKLGIKYMPCLIYGKVNPEAYRIWEDIDGRWDSNGVWGVSIHEIDYFWYISGCRDCQKYRILFFIDYKENRKKIRRLSPIRRSSSYLLNTADNRT